MGRPVFRAILLPRALSVTMIRRPGASLSERQGLPALALQLFPAITGRCFDIR
jgi:hypothetical protein